MAYIYRRGDTYEVDGKASGWGNSNDLSRDDEYGSDGVGQQNTSITSNTNKSRE